MPRRFGNAAHAGDLRERFLGWGHQLGVGDLLQLRCTCGYYAQYLVTGGIMSGVMELFACRTCVEVVPALTWSAGGLGAEHTPGTVVPVCEKCGNTLVAQWGSGAPPTGPCPRCKRAVTTTSVGIAD